MDWNLALELAEEHSVQGVVTERLKESGHLGMPADAWEKLQGNMRTQHLFTLSWRFLRQWSLETTVGDAGTSILDLVWQHRY